MRIFLAGGTGKIGARLVPRMLKRGDTVVALSQSAAKVKEKFGDRVEAVEGDPTQPGPWMAKVSGCDGVVNLVGEDIFARRWNDEFKRVLRDSRLQSTARMVEAVQSASAKPEVLVQGSAIGYYGDRGDETITEDSPAAPAGTDFLADLCVEWERAAVPAETAGTRLVLLRTGVVLDREGGALKTMWTPFKMFVGGKVGSGRQWVSWIHHADEVGLILFALDNGAVRGPLNGVAPNPVTNKQLAKALGGAMGRPSFFPTPGFMIRMMLGEVAGLVTTGARILPKKALDNGYVFKYPLIDGGMAELVAAARTA